MKVITLWLFPILFIFHDLEEILFMEKWINKNYSQIVSALPTMFTKIIPDVSYITTKSFAFGATEELVIIIVVTALAVMMQWYYIWLGLFITFSLHIIIHIIQALIIRRYIPSLLTSVICLPICYCIIMNTVLIMQAKLVIFYSVIGFIIMVINLVFIHRLMRTQKTPK